MDLRKTSCKGLHTSASASSSATITSFVYPFRMQHMHKRLYRTKQGIHNPLRTQISQEMYEKMGYPKTNWLELSPLSHKYPKSASFRAISTRSHIIIRTTTKSYEQSHHDGEIARRTHGRDGTSSGIVSNRHDVRCRFCTSTTPPSDRPDVAPNQCSSSYDGTRWSICCSRGSLEYFFSIISLTYRCS